MCPSGQTPRVPTDDPSSTVVVRTMLLVGLKAVPCGGGWAVVPFLAAWYSVYFLTAALVFYMKL